MSNITVAVIGLAVFAVCGMLGNFFLLLAAIEERRKIQTGEERPAEGTEQKND